MTSDSVDARSAAAHINSIATIVHDYLNSGIKPNPNNSVSMNNTTGATGQICPFCTGTGFKGTFGCPHCGGAGHV